AFEDARISNITFAGPTSFNQIHVGALHVTNCKFHDAFAVEQARGSDATVSVRGSTMKGIVSFRRSSLRSVEISPSSSSISLVEFSKSAIFDGLRCDSLSIKGGVFVGEASFVGASFNHQCALVDCLFLEKTSLNRVEAGTTVTST